MFYSITSESPASAIIKQFNCQLCKKNYKSFTALKNHQRIKHLHELDLNLKNRGRPKRFTKELEEQQKNEFIELQKKN